jgi:hypothetical protein
MYIYIYIHTQTYALHINCRGHWYLSDQVILKYTHTLSFFVYIYIYIYIYMHMHMHTQMPAHHLPLRLVCKWSSNLEILSTYSCTCTHRCMHINCRGDWYVGKEWMRTSYQCMHIYVDACILTTVVTGNWRMKIDICRCMYVYIYACISTALLTGMSRICTFYQCVCTSRCMHVKNCGEWQSNHQVIWTFNQWVYAYIYACISTTVVNHN